ncbi:DUF5683 domain-containing protein [Pedobacter mucosus]|uniref:DUF5683 domain-containing protein n=1 Tax=Pedobacter mucosus TaxID=2895286 RepID=UPI001EE3B232|nr:DUF5683 domain-containing protein [Pedobacter mucosus]UKT62668.1 DUF5683 domain-containing protein [Pedobacter mucosus]
MQTKSFLFLIVLFVFFAVNQVAGQVRDTVFRKPDTLKNQEVKPAPKVMTSRDSAKARYVNPGKVAARKAVMRSFIFPGLGQIYNIHLLNDGYGTRAGKNQTAQKIYTIGKIAAIYGGFGALTLSYIESSKNYNLFLKELQDRTLTGKIDPNSPYATYSTAGITTAKDTYRRNKQIVIFSYVLLYGANVVDAYVAARLHFFNIDDKLSFKIMPSMINTNTVYGFNASPAIKLSLTF